MYLMFRNVFERQSSEYFNILSFRESVILLENDRWCHRIFTPWFTVESHPIILKRKNKNSSKSSSLIDVIHKASDEANLANLS